MTKPPQRLFIANQGGEVKVTRTLYRARSQQSTFDELRPWQIHGEYRALDASYSPGEVILHLEAHGGSVISHLRLALPLGALQYALEQAGFDLVKKG